MNRSWVLAALAVVALASCSKSDNPLVGASDGQFAQWIEPRNAFSASCAAAQAAEKAFLASIHCANCPSLAATSGLSDFVQDASAATAAAAHIHDLFMRPPRLVHWEVDSDCKE